MKMRIEMEQFPEERQPKHSVRYGFRRGQAGIDSIYIKRAAFIGDPPQRITVEIHEDN